MKDSKLVKTLCVPVIGRFFSMQNDKCRCMNAE